MLRVVGALKRSEGSSVGAEGFQPRASSSAIMRPVSVDLGVLRLRFLPELEGSALRYLEAR